MKFLLVLPLLLVSCAAIPGGGGKVTYRYVNSLDFGNDNTLDAVTVTGYDEQNNGEATRLDLTVGGSRLTLRDPYGDGNGGGYMYNPAVGLGSDGALVITWSRIGEVLCRAEITSGPQGQLIERKRSVKDLSR
ncbi:hypothetical protein JIN84_04480 [Luteolibacter yonseiensis]|uniref:Lipoprotein n=1 Tax=Luteolibacter yonseiensis TaxID=1144680 RepID=A0A934R2F3_9BACT|nr:hypothetical protein [Luteolibacter yonseiensis]MBK1814858.1 hypothetical protein [Luteolibacter yonseiensis]